MRILHSRGNYQPSNRIDGLRRYAFIGDSMTFGHGVASVHALPAVAERQINSQCADGPAEVINFGVNGYNIWNNWLDFIAAPQVYDGVVLVLCSNDAEFFGRTYKVRYPGLQFPIWQKSHPCGEAVVRCFEEIAAYSKKQSLPVAVFFYGLVESAPPLRVSETVREQCALHGLLFVDSMAPIKDRHFNRADLVVSEANAHPSVMVHEAVGRYLVQTLHRQGWFGAQGETPIGTMAERIVSSARTMIELDGYPSDVVHHWAQRTLEVKLHRARRLEALETDSSASASASATLEQLTAINRCWHLGQRLHAFINELSSLQPGLTFPLWSVEEERHRLDELNFALGTGLWDRLSTHLPNLSSLRPPTQEEEKLPEPLPFFDESILSLQHFGEALDKIRLQPVPTLTELSPTRQQIQADLDTLSQLRGRLSRECHSTKKAFEKITKSIAVASPSLGYEESKRVSLLAGEAIHKTQKCLGFIRHWPGKIEQMQKPEYPTHTNIEVTLRTPATEDKGHSFIFARAEYRAPYRLSSMDTGNFFTDGTCKLVKLFVPLLYCGRIHFSFNKISGEPVAVELVKVQIYNLAHRCVELTPELFYLDHLNRLISPLIYLY